MTDTIPTDFDFEKERRNMLLEEGEIHDVTRIGKKLGLTCKIAISNALFQQLYPYGEDATKGVTFDNMMEDVLRLFKKENVRSNQMYTEFELVTKTYVKRVHSHDNIETFADGKARDKRLNVWVGWMPDEKKKPSLIMGVKNVSFGP